MAFLPPPPRAQDPAMVHYIYQRFQVLEVGGIHAPDPGTWSLVGLLILLYTSLPTGMCFSR